MLAKQVSRRGATNHSIEDVAWGARIANWGNLMNSE